MSAVPLAVRLDSADGSLNLTKQVSTLRFKSVARGGYASVQVALQRPIDSKLLAQFTDLLVFDTENGQQVGGGRLMDQGRSVSESGQVWQITALGEGLASMQDRKEPLFYIDSTLEYWRMERRTHKRMTGEIGVPGDGTQMAPGLLFTAVEDKTLNVGDEVLMLNRLAQVTGQTIAAVGLYHREGASGSNLRTQVRIYDSAITTAETPLDDAWSTSGGGTRKIAALDAQWSTPNPIVGVRWIRLNTSGAASDDTWSRVATPTLQTRMYDRTGSLRPASFYSDEYVLASSAFVDICARWCPRLDIANASLAGSSHQYTQLAWIDGIDGMSLMEDMLDVEPAYTWAVWDKQSNGKWATEFRALSTDVRYEASVIDGFDAPSPSTEVYSRVAVRGKVESGYPKTAFRNQDVPDLTAAGLTRSTTIDLGDELYASSTADKRGDSFLDGAAAPPNAGTLTVARKIYDNQTGRWVKPYEIRPGYLIRVRGVQPTPDTLNASGANGSTVFNIVSNEFSADQAASTLELDDYELTTARAIANVARRRNRKR